MFHCVNPQIHMQSQLAASSTTLASSKEEVKRLELQLKKAKNEAETVVSGLHKQHAAVVKVLEDKVCRILWFNNQLLILMINRLESCNKK